MIAILSTPRAQQVLKWLVLAAMLLFIVALVFFWFGGRSFNEKDVVLLLDGPAQAASGDQATYTVHYRNNTKLKLEALHFRFFYPEDSVIERDGAFVQESSEGFTVDELKPGEEGKKEIKIFLVGDKGSIKVSKVDLIFQAGSLTSSFQKSESLNTAITTVPIPMTLVAPPSVVSGQNVSYILDYRNNSPDDIRNVRFEFGLPEGFVIQSSTPAATLGTTWDVPLIKTGGGARITVRGVLSGNERESKEVTVTLKRQVSNQYVIYERASSSTIISSPLLSLNFQVNNVDNYGAFPGDSLRYSITYRNASNYTLVGLTLIAKLDGDMFDFNTVQSTTGFYDANAKSVVWNAGAVPNLGNLSPGQNGKVEFFARLKDSFPSGLLGAKNFFVEVNANLSTPNVPTGLDGDQVATENSITTKISTQPDLNETAYANDPAFGSSGPTPPQVGQKTIYTIHWALTNPGNDVSGAIVKALLPPGVTWEDNASTGAGQAQPTFDRTRSEISWPIGTLPQGTGTLSPKYEGTFRVSITPTAAQRGSTMTLVKGAVFSGTDNFTKQSLLTQSVDINTGQTVDRPDEGTVQ